MAKVSKLKIAQQSGTDNTYFASWEFTESKTTSSSTSSSGSGSVKVGSLVSIKSGATYYNGVSIPSWVMQRKWYIVQVKGDRAVLGKDESGSYNIQSAINTKYLNGGSTSSGSGSSGSTTTTTDVKNVDHYEVKWWYDSGNGQWFNGSSEQSDRKNATYSPPSNAIRIKVGVKPVSKTYESNGKETSYWTGYWEYAEYSMDQSTPKTPNTPTVVIENFSLTATVDGIDDPLSDAITFQVYVDNVSTPYKSATVNVSTQRARHQFKIEAGRQYRVRARAVNLTSTTSAFSAWSAFSGEDSTVPTSVTGLKCVAESANSVKLTWSSVTAATSYKIEYTNKKAYFDSASGVQSITVENTTGYVTGLDSGQWYFRVRAVNEKGEGSWSEIVSTVVGSKPEPPTTWSLTSSAIVGEDVTLYWVHNTEDGSKMVEGKIELDINGTISTITVPGTNVEEGEEEEDQPICYYTFNTKEYDDGAIILWRVKTQGITGDWSDWSTQRTINLYAPPTLSMVVGSIDLDNGNLVTDALKSLPIAILLESGPVNQTPLSYHISIIAKNSYESEEPTGDVKIVSAGSEVYSEMFHVTEHSLIEVISAGDIILENGQEYIINSVVSMNSGLTATDSKELTVAWTDPTLVPDARMAVDKDTLAAYITPFCVDESGMLAPDVLMSVYRRETNGNLVEIATGIPNDMITTVTDPHPALDYARYRIVAIHTLTSEVVYEDFPGYPIGEPSIVIQWDEVWRNYDYAEDAIFAEQPWAGSMLKLPYNVDVSESYEPDVSLIEYIGRKHPVSYYGTQRGETARWSTDVPKYDKETIHALRRLAAYPGDVYVREPSGTGYWARVRVSFPINHLELVVPVSFDITRVEGGI